MGDQQNLGDQIRDAVQDALNSRNFQQLNRSIGSTVDSALEEVRKNISHLQTGPTNINEQQREEIYRQQDHPFRNRVKQVDPGFSQTSANERGGQMGVSRPSAPGRLTATGTKENIIGGILLAFGVLGTVVFGILTAVFGGIGLASGVVGFGVTTGMMILFLILCIVVICIGSGMRGRIRRFKEYNRIIGGRGYVNIEELAQKTGRTEKYVARDVRKMIQMRLYKMGHLDEQNTCLMVTYEAYQSYLQSLEGQKMRLQEEEQKKKTQQQREGETPDEKAFREAMEKGKQYLTQIREANAAIPGEEISSQLDRMETVIRRIFAQVKEHPEQLPELRRFMDYYLPTTLKLVNTYRELDGQPVQGENIVQSKQEIEKTLGTIEQAFAKLLDSLFESTAMDVSTDISVLKTMFAQEGLTDSELKMRNQTKEDEKKMEEMKNE